MYIKEFQLPLKRITTTAPDVKIFELEKPENFSYKPGQFMMLSLPKCPKNQNAYSLSSSPTEPRFQFTIKINPEGGKLSPYLDDLNEGDIIKLKGPYGMFTYEETQHDEIVFIAGGTGLAPLRSMYKYIVDKNIEKNLALFFSIRTPKHMLYKDELKELGSINKLKTTITVTRPEESDEPWDGETGRIDKTFLEKYLKNKDSLIYICGPPRLVDGIVSSLQEAGVNKENLKFEKWS